MANETPENRSIGPKDLERLEAVIRDIRIKPQLNPVKRDEIDKCP
jgi:hypothetical protein